MEAPDQPRLILREGQSAHDSFPIDRPELILGRDPAADILIDSPGVSRRHARLYQEAGACWLEDLASRNGTFVNGERLSAPCHLQSKDEVRLGQSVLLVFEEPPRVNETAIEAGLTVEQPPLPQETMLEAPSGVAATMIGDDLQFAPRTPPRLTITVAGQKPFTHT
ncbi:FHA domain-containing protein, partial [bacterium]|nr:FHA domain-containing protein [bacterium]